MTPATDSTDTLDVRFKVIERRGYGNDSATFKDLLSQFREIRIAKVSYECPAGGNECEINRHVCWSSSLGERTCSAHGITWTPGEEIIYGIPK